MKTLKSHKICFFFSLRDNYLALVIAIPWLPCLLFLWATPIRLCVLTSGHILCVIEYSRVPKAFRNLFFKSQQYWTVAISPSFKKILKLLPFFMGENWGFESKWFSGDTQLASCWPRIWIRFLNSSLCSLYSNIVPLHHISLRLFC